MTAIKRLWFLAGMTGIGSLCLYAGMTAIAGGTH
jgi:hypothetical protein